MILASNIFLLLVDDLGTCARFDYKDAVSSGAAWTTNIRDGLEKLAALSEYPQGSPVKYGRRRTTSCI